MSELSGRTTLEPIYGADEDRCATRERLSAGDVPISVYGLDRSGLSLAATLAASAGNVVAADIDEALVEQLSEGQCPYEDVDGLEAIVADTAATSDLRATTSLSEAATQGQLHVVHVSPSMDGEPDLSPVEAALSAVAQGLHPGDLVVVESTLPVGTCRNELHPLLVDESELDPGAFGFAFTPERHPQSGLRGLDADHERTVAGIDDESRALAAAAYGSLVDASFTAVDDLETAELAALLAGVSRTVMTALSNELARHATGLDGDLQTALSAVRGRTGITLPDPNLGVRPGHQPGYVDLLASDLGTDTRLLEAARVTTDLMPTHACITLFDAFELVDLDPADARVLVVGVDSHTGLSGQGQAPAVPLSRWLTDEGVTVDVTGHGSAEPTHLETAGARIVDVESVLDGEYDAIVLASPTVDVPDAGTMASLGTDDHALIVLDGYQLLPELRNDAAVIYRGIGINA